LLVYVLGFERRPIAHHTERMHSLPTFTADICAVQPPESAHASRPIHVT